MTAERRKGEKERNRAIAEEGKELRQKWRKIRMDKKGRKE
jgi:hypothetical protein